MKAGFIPVIIAFLVTTSASFGQQVAVQDPYLTQCKITFSVTYPELQPTIAMASSTPTEKTIFLKDEKMRVETKMADGHVDVILVDCKNKIAHSLTEASGKKYAVKTTPDDIQKECTGIPYLEVKLLDEFKEIAGYHCQKDEYLIRDKNNETFTCDVFTNFKIIATNPNWYNAPYREVAYFMFEYSQKQNGVVIKYSAKSVEPFKENESIFNVPSGYKEMPKAEFTKIQPNSN